MENYHTLVIPTCDRPDFIRTAVKYFLQNPDPQLRVLICDASSRAEPTKAVLQEFKNEKRMVYLNNTVQKNGRVISMLENWNTALDNVNSKWVSVIGDDDVLDPHLIAFLRQIELKDPTIESVRWKSAKAPVVGTWNGEAVHSPIRVPMGTKTYLANNDIHLQKILTWDTFPNVPQKLSGLYHGAVKMDLMKRLKKRRGQWFKYANLDFEIGWLISQETENTLFSERPFSINGASPKSNSWGVARPHVAKRNLEYAISQGAILDGWTHGFIEKFLRDGGDFHFLSMLAVTVFGTTIRFHDEIGRQISSDTKLNFAKILILRSRSMQNMEDFKWYIKNTKIILTLLFEKKVDFREPSFEQDKSKASNAGLIANELFLPRSKFPGDYDQLVDFILSILKKL